MVGRLVSFWVPVYFQGRTVKLQVGKPADFDYWGCPSHGEDRISLVLPGWHQSLCIVTFRRLKGPRVLFFFWGGEGGSIEEKNANAKRIGFFRGSFFGIMICFFEV